MNDFITSDIFDIDYKTLMSEPLIKTAALIAVTFLSLKFGKRILNRSLLKDSINTKQKTLIPVVYQVYRFLVVFIAGCIALPIFGISATPLVAVSSSIGLVVGIGAQQTIKDLISGFFILSESQFQIGDIVSVANVKGKVVEIGLRTTILKDLGTGERIIVPNSVITIVQNASSQNVVALAEVTLPNGVPYTYIKEKLETELIAVFDASIMKSHPKLLGLLRSDHVSYTIGVQTLCKIDNKAKVESMIRDRIRLIEENYSLANKI